VGVDEYPNLPKRCGPQADAPCDLSFAGADAKAFADTAERQMGGQHLRLEKRVLFNGAGGNLEPVRDNIENAFDLLLEAKDNDTIAVFIAGHGYNDPRSGYQFLPSNARPGDSSNLASSSVIKWTTLESAIQTAKGRRLLFVDTCHSGNAFNARLIKDTNDGRIVPYSATNTQQEALELRS
jgi:Caspase domain